MQTGITEREVRLAKKLASNSKKVRDKTIKALHRYLRNCSEGELDEVALQKLWKGLFYCMWMSDKRPVQLQLATHISQLMHHLPTVHNQFTFFKCFLLIISREWHGIDNLRLDKFYDLVKKMCSVALGIALKGAKIASQASAGTVSETVLGDASLVERRAVEQEEMEVEEEEEEDEEEEVEEDEEEEEEVENGSEDGEEDSEEEEDVARNDEVSLPGEDAVFGWMTAMVSGLDQDKAVGAVLHIAEHFVGLLIANLPDEAPTPDTLSPTHFAALLFPFFQLLATATSNLVADRIQVEVFGRILRVPKVEGEAYTSEREYFEDEDFVTKTMHMQYLKETRRFAEYFETVAASLFEMGSDPSTSEQQRGKIYKLREKYINALTVPTPRIPCGKKAVFDPKTSTEVVHKRKKGKKRKLNNTELKKRRKRRRTRESRLMPV